jgi:hypothetical protein
MAAKRRRSFDTKKAPAEATKLTAGAIQKSLLTGSKNDACNGSRKT